MQRFVAVEPFHLVVITDDPSMDGGVLVGAAPESCDDGDAFSPAGTTVLMDDCGFPLAGAVVGAAEGSSVFSEAVGWLLLVAEEGETCAAPAFCSVVVGLRVVADKGVD